MFVRPYTRNYYCNFQNSQLKTINYYTNFKLSNTKFLYLMSFTCNFVIYYYIFKYNY